MAAGGKETAQIAIIPNTECEICEVNDIRWKCFNCDEYLCDQCKIYHLKGKGTRNHKITTVSGSDQQERKYGTKRDSYCSTHIDETFLMFCNKCDVPLCRECIASEVHIHHKLVKIEDVIDRQLVDLSKIAEVTKQRLSRLEEIVKSLDKNELEYCNDISKRKDETKTRNAQIKRELDNITDDIISTLTKKEEEYREQTKRRRDEIQKMLSELKKTLAKCKDQQTHKDVAMVQFVVQVKQCMDQYQPPDPPNPTKPPEFIPENVNIQQLKSVFGEIDLKSGDRSAYKALQQSPETPSIDVQIMSTLKMSSKPLVAAIDDNKAWLGDWNRKGISLVKSDGQTIKSINTDFSLHDMVITKSGELLLTVYDGNIVKQLMSDDTSKDIYTAEQGFNTFGITVTDDDNIAVGLYNSNQKKGKIVILSSCGHLLTTVEKDRNGKHVLKNLPWRISRNKNGDLIVEQGKEVIAVNKSGDRVFTYRGQGRNLKKPFDPWYVVTDKYGHILISDYYNSVIHLLDKDGNFLRFLLTEQHGLDHPMGMSIDKSNQLWVDSYWNDKIMVVKYL